MCFSWKIMHAQPYSALYRKFVGYMHAVSICKGCGETEIDLVQGVLFKRVAPFYEPGQKEITNKLQILHHCSKDFQCRIVAFRLNIRQWYYILRRDSKFLLACVLLSPMGMKRYTWRNFEFPMGQEISYPLSLFSKAFSPSNSTFLLVFHVLTVCDTASFSAGHRIVIKRKNCYY